LKNLALRNLLYYQYGKNAEVDKHIDRAIVQWYPRGKRGQLSPDTFVYAIWAARQAHVAAPLDELRVAVDVLEQIQFASFNSDRWDLMFDDEIAGRTHVIRALPRDEHTSLMWSHEGDDMMCDGENLLLTVVCLCRARFHNG
jgi:hypothetical protein